MPISFLSSSPSEFSDHEQRPGVRSLAADRFVAVVSDRELPYYDPDCTTDVEAQ
jgi:hypothetical protein